MVVYGGYQLLVMRPISVREQPCERSCEVSAAAREGRGRNCQEESCLLSTSGLTLISLFSSFH